MPGTAEKIIRNTIYNSTGFISLVLVNLLLTPYILSKLGSQRFAIWSLIFVVTMYLSFLDFGITGSFAKYIAEYHAKKDSFSVNAVINCGLLFFLGYTLLIVLAVFLFRNTIAAILKIPPSLKHEFLFTLVWITVIFAIFNGLRIFRETLFGIQRMDVLNKITVTSSIFYAAGVFFFLRNNWGIRGLVISYAVQCTLIILGNIYFSRKFLPALKIGFTFIRKEIFRKLFGFGIKMQICSLAALVHLQTDKIILSYFLGLNFVTFYELGQKAASAVKMIPALLLSALVPAISELEAVSGHEKLKDLYRRGSKYICLVVFPLLFMTLMSAPQLIKLWIGEGYDLSVLTFQILTIEYTLNMLTGMGTSIVRGIGKPEYEARYAVIVMALQLILSITLVRVMGYRGILLSLLVSGITGSLYFLSTFHKFFEEKLVRFFEEVYLKSLSSSVLALLVVLILSFYLRKLVAFHAEWEYLALLLFKLAVFIGVFLLLIVKSKYIDMADIRLFKSYRGKA
jgi:O-antigen/teichoic acid export membrane protein